jgi:hypothetical protein
MKGAGNQPSFQSHLELHGALLSTARLTVGSTIIPRQAVNAYLMQATGVGIRQSVNRYLEAWEDLCLIAPGWNSKAKVKTVHLLDRPDGLGDDQLSEVLAGLGGQSPHSS